MGETRFAYHVEDRLRLLLAAAVANVFLGLVLAAIPWVAAAEEPIRWTNLGAGLLVAAFASWQAWAAWSEDAEPSRWVSVANVVLAIFAMAATMILEPSYRVAAANVTVGLVVVVLATFNAWVAGQSRRTRPLHRVGF